MNPQLTLLILCLPLTLATQAALQEFTIGNNLFTSEVYTEITKTEPGNFLVSPLSTETVLALTQSGAVDATGEEVRKVLHLPNQEQIENAVKSLQPILRSNELYTLKTANKIYLKNGFEVKDSFKKVATESFGSEVENVDFERRDAAAGTINRWVEDRTENKIKNLINPNDLTVRTRAILVNALYFRGNWSSSFENFQTFKEDFYKSGTERLPVDTMHDTSHRRYFESAELNSKFIELPFDGSDITFTVVLPNDKNGLPELEKNVQKVLQAPNYTDTFVKLALPKFKIETQLDFKEILKKLGVQKIFEEKEADLSGLAGNKGDLAVDKVVQKTFVDVNEQGVEAAAATFVDVVVPLSGFVDLDPPKEFIADHPFIFYIKVKDLVIFAGRVVDPSVK